MARTVVALIAGVIIGGTVAWFLAASPPEKPEEIVRDIVAVPKMSVSEGDEHREASFETLQTIEQILALPTRFMQAEALHVLAGRSDSAQIQNLIFEANRVADEQDRENTQKILFYRLTELDPYSALALTQTEYFSGSAVTERQVWMAFGLSNLDEALAVAKEQTSPQRRHTAAQSFYAAFGYMGNRTTDRIEAALGVPPDSGTRAQFLYRMADRSPAAAIAYINAMDSLVRRREFVSWLANYLTGQDADRAASFEALFDKDRDRELYSAVVARDSVQSDPQAVIDRLIASGRSGLNPGAIRGALYAIAEQNLDAALAYFDQLTSLDDRRSLGASIVTQLAKRDIEEALAWARANDKGDFPMMTLQVLRQIAEDDPQRALEEALAVGNMRKRSNLIMSLASTMGRTNPRQALELASAVSNKQQQRDVRQQVVSQWMRNDPDAAINWILGQDEATVNDLVGQSSQNIIRHNPEAAMRLLPVLSGDVAAQWRYQIAQHLASLRSPEDALNFVSRFEGQEGFENLQSAIITGVAQHDPDQARMMADQLADPRARDAAYSQIIMHKANSDPASAVGTLNVMSEGMQKETSAGSLARQWAWQDATGARQWVENLPRSKVRDAAIAGLAGTWETVGPEEEALVNSIESQTLREQAKTNRIYTLVRTDPESARKLLDDTDISEAQRQRILVMIEQYKLQRGR